MPAPSQTQSHLRYPLTSILGSAGSVRVLRALVAGRTPQSASQLAAGAGLTPQGVRLVLEALVRRQLAIVHGAGRTQLYTLNPAHPFAAALVALFQQEQRRWDELLEAIRKLLSRQGPAVSAAWLYGSVARGEDSPASDLDIAILVSSRAVAGRVRVALLPLEEDQQLRISLVALTPKELSSLPDDDPWWADVVRDGRILKGPAPEQVRRRLAKAAA